jgi:hypothetical protein
MSLPRLLRLLLVPTAVVAVARIPFPPTVNPGTELAALPEPPIPSDPLELVPSSAQPVQDATQRAAIVGLLADAKVLASVRAYPYDLRTTFTVVGSSSSDGAWQLENISPGRGLYRWTAEGPGYSVVNLFQNRMLYSNQPGAGIPLRLAQVRAAIFYVDSVFGPRASIRTASANLNGTELTCALTERMSAPKTATGGRLWEEAEFCVDPKSGLLMTYSPVPGLYILYDYTNALHFYDKIIPGKFTITEAGRTVIEARNESLTDPAKLDPSLFEPSGLNSVGAGPLESPPWNMRSSQYSANGSTNPTLQVVVLHAMVSPDGHMTESEVLASSDSNLNQRALNHLVEWQNLRGMEGDAQPGASPQSHELFFTLRFMIGGG